MNDEFLPGGCAIAIGVGVALFSALLVVLALIVSIGVFVLTGTASALEPITLPDATTVQLVSVVDSIPQPIYLTHAGDDRLFVASRNGNIYIVRDGVMQNIPFLNISGHLHPDAFQRPNAQAGLVSLAFHPDYANNGEFYIAYTNVDGEATVARYHVSDISPDIADWSSGEVIFTADLDALPVTPEGIFPVRNGARHIAFGPDDNLYLSIGDGELTNLGAELSPDSYRGTLVRFDPDAEIWSYGLRNAWRFSFDTESGDLFIGDIGASNWEEINYQPANGHNASYGWSFYEGTSILFGEFNPNTPPTDSALPILEYPHEEGGDCAVIGGYVYRGELIPDLQGVYLYGDYCSGKIRAGYRTPSGEWQSELFLDTDYNIVSFGEDSHSELYVIDFDGTILRLEPSTPLENS